MANDIEAKAMEKMIADWMLTVPGLSFDQSATGELNGQVIKSFLALNKLPMTVENLDAAVRLEAKRFIWSPGTAPGEAEAKAAAVLQAKTDAAAARRKASGIDTIGAGGRENTNSYNDRVADQIERLKADAAAKQTAEDARKRAADVALRQKEETAWIYYDSNGRINMGESLTQQARAKAKWAAYFGEAAPAARPTALREFSSDGPELTKAELYALTSEELSRYIKSRNQLRWQTRR